MIRSLSPVWLIAAQLAAAWFLIAAPSARAARFVVLDQKAPEELAEITRLYIDGSLVATVRLDAATTEARIPVSVPDSPGRQGGAHDYALCGQITFRNQTGGREIHEVSGQGELPDPDGRAFDALGARDFTLFYLADPTDRDAVHIEPGHSLFCQTPIS